MKWKATTICLPWSNPVLGWDSCRPARRIPLRYVGKLSKTWTFGGRYPSTVSPAGSAARSLPHYSTCCAPPTGLLSRRVSRPESGAKRVDLHALAIIRVQIARCYQAVGADDEGRRDRQHPGGVALICRHVPSRTGNQDLHFRPDPDCKIERQRIAVVHVGQDGEWRVSLSL